MSMRCVHALARVVFAGVLAVLPCAARAGDVSPEPSAIEMATLSPGLAAGHESLLPPANSQKTFGEAFAEPAGFVTPIGQGSLLNKWNAAQAELRIDIAIIAACRAALEACESEAAKRIVAIVEDARTREGRALIGTINRAVNLAIAPMSDKAQYGVEDKWASPLTTFTSRHGDCEDYALAKYAALRSVGFAEDELRLLLVRLPQSQTDHAVLSVRHDGRWLILDNRRFAMLDAVHLDAVPLFALRENKDGNLAVAYGGSGNAPNVM